MEKEKHVPRGRPGPGVHLARPAGPGGEHPVRQRPRQAGSAVGGPAVGHDHLGPPGAEGSEPFEDRADRLRLVEHRHHDGKARHGEVSLAGFFHVPGIPGRYVVHPAAPAMSAKRDVPAGGAGSFVLPRSN